jgi:hypothetical protein
LGDHITGFYRLTHQTLYVALYVARIYLQSINNVKDLVALRHLDFSQRLSGLDFLPGAHQNAARERQDVAA